MWSLLTTALALLIPLGAALVVAGGRPNDEARRVLLASLPAFPLAATAYLAVGFALHYGGIGLQYDNPEFEALVWEWTALTQDWAATWGMAGWAGFFMRDVQNALTYALFLSALPFATTAAMLPMLALSGRAPTLITVLFGLLTAAVGYPAVANWVQGGGWLANLGVNIAAGHGFVDVGGAFLFLLGGGAALAAMFIFLDRRPASDESEAAAPGVWMSALGAGLILVGSIGWLLAWPLTNWETLNATRIALNAWMAAAGGGLAALVLGWLGLARPASLHTARGVVAGCIAGMAGAAFVPLEMALLIGAAAAALMMLAIFLLEDRLRLQDQGGVFATFGLPAGWGLLAVGLFADGTAGVGFNGVGTEQYLGVVGQGVTGLFAAAGFAADWPGQMQAQAVGAAAIFLLAFLAASLLLSPIALLLRGRAAKKEEETK
ncbi:MAG: hypothetical protein GXP42_04015 [Chloroflexi bacterium]|nr:hypothetical protein [Chloroflexota bacterium]